MNIVTERDQIREIVAERRFAHLALDPETTTAEEISKRVGGEGWRSVTCDSCVERVAFPVLLLGWRNEEEIYLCLDCVKEAYAMTKPRPKCPRCKCESFNTVPVYQYNSYACEELRCDACHYQGSEHDWTEHGELP